MVSPPTPFLRVPRSLTAPDAWIAILLVSYLQFKQYTRRKHNVKRLHGGKSKPERMAFFSLVHQCLFTNLRMMVSPFTNQASDLGAEMVDLQSEQELNSYAKKVASGKTPKKKSKNGGGGGKDGKTMEVRSRRIMKGELVFNPYYEAVETMLNLALSVIVGLASRWSLGLIRSLKLSLVSSNPMSISGPGGPCCSPYLGGDDEGSRLPGSFERLLACILIKQEGDNAGTLFFTLILLAFFVGIINLAWSSSTGVSKESEAHDECGKIKKNEEDKPYRRIHPRKVKRFIVGVAATFSSLMLFHTPALLRVLGLDGLTEAAEEWGSRVLLFGNLLGITSLPTTNTMEEPSDTVATLMNGLLAFLAIAWGYIAAGMMTPIEETARNAAHVLSPSSNKGNKPRHPNEMLDLINTRMMLLIQAMAPLIIMCTYLFNARFAETMKSSARGEHIKMTFSKQYLRNSGLFMRVVLSWCFIGASAYTFRSLLQSFLDQATTVASAMAALGEGVMNDDANVGSRDKRATASSSQPSPTKPQQADPFNERYRTVVLTAGRVAVFPLFVLAMLATAHLRGGDGSTHPGVGHVSQPRDAPRSILPVKGILPPYSDRYMSWIASQSKPHHEAGAGDTLLHVAAVSQLSWDFTPYRDTAHKKVASLIGKFCYPPKVQSIKAVGRHVNFLLDNDGGAEDEESILTVNPLTGRELISMSPPTPVTFADLLSGRISPDEGSCEKDNVNAKESTTDEDTINSQGTEECKASENRVHIAHYPTISEFLFFLTSHTFMTPSIVFPIVDTFAFLSSIWWTYWYSFMTLVYWIRLRKSADFLRIAA
ncbi:hypothetical protein ACHAXR_009207 [Thalassiosira sp. AJA248-18]